MHMRLGEERPRYLPFGLVTVLNTLDRKSATGNVTQAVDGTPAWEGCKEDSERHLQRDNAEKLATRIRSGNQCANRGIR
jgi:hypothetical protein